MQVVLGICAQISRQAFYNELIEYYNCALEYMQANLKEFTTSDYTALQGLKPRIGKMKPQLKVSLMPNKKLDKMFWQLFE